MKIEGVLSKMKGMPDGNNNVRYNLHFNDAVIDMNSHIGKELQFTFLNEMFCTICGVKIKHTYAGKAICRNCYHTAPEAEECLFYPEKCKAHLGIARDIKWSEEHCLIPHYVYLALSSGLKVGVTRHHQIPVRWIDQGAIKAVKIARTPNRHIAGVIEVFLKDFFADKTNWKQMMAVSSGDFSINLSDEKKRALDLLPTELKKYSIDDDEIYEFNYPVPEVIPSPAYFSFEKEKSIKGILSGIKGQYLIFDNGKALNMNNFSGYKVEIKFSES
ncbi:MAG: DUF2797 domain-containing protein [Chlorobi bacterium]|nr:DUF2797 domain-containing protein [Chlorobiota bacterium]